jgi:predicted TIM-barrel fold metal-dependent hydrolase
MKSILRSRDTLDDSRAFFPDHVWAELRERLVDLHEKRLRLMDAHGVEMMFLSLNAPAVRAIPDAKQANETARKANDFLAEQVQERPDRFQALAALPMQDPELASRELNRCVKERHAYPARKKISEYFSENFYLTTSGNFRTQTLICTMLEVGADRIPFSTDYPFENVDHAAEWFDHAAISESDRRKIGRTNALKLFKLGG